jgi:CheY-like chemotaxis protein
MTGHNIRQNEIKAIEAGCNAYLHKPFSPTALIDAIEKRAA